MNPVEICRALGDPIRWRIVRLVVLDALCVCELAEILGMPQSSVSSHVQIIRRAGLLESEKRGKWTYFRIQTKFISLYYALEREIIDHPSKWIEDSKKAGLRLLERQNSCCPGPKKLASPQPENTATLNFPDRNIIRRTT